MILTPQVIAFLDEIYPKVSFKETEKSLTASVTLNGEELDYTKPKKAIKDIDSFLKELRHALARAVYQ